MVYQAMNRSPKDANVIIRNPICGNDDIDFDVIPARILSLFSDNRTPETKMRSYAVVERHVAVDVDHDPYHRFGFVVAGGLFRDEYYAPQVIDTDDLVTQFGKTCFFHGEFGAKVVHVLPIFKVYFI
jgi:hypothetical protein